MRLKLRHALIIPVLLAPAVFAQENSKAPETNTVSYAFGMNLGIQIKQMGADVDVNAIVQAIKDVEEGKPAKLPQADLRAILKQEEDFALAKIAAKDKAEGAAFLATNATAPGITVLPDGLQYRVLQAGTGATPKMTDVVSLKYRGTLIDGTEFDHNDHIQTSIVSQMLGWQEALPRMKVGSKWQLFVPPNLAYGRKWLRQVKPESTVIFELELLSIETPAARSDGPRVIAQ